MATLHQISGVEEVVGDVAPSDESGLLEGHEAFNVTLKPRGEDAGDELHDTILERDGADWPVSDSPDPLEAVQGLVTRADPHGLRSGTLWVEQAITLDEALDAVTIAAARSMDLDELTGSLTAGKSADFVILDGTLDEAHPERIAATRVRETWFSGRQVFRR